MAEITIAGSVPRIVSQRPSAAAVDGPLVLPDRTRKYSPHSSAPEQVPRKRTHSASPSPKVSDDSSQFYLTMDSPWDSRKSHPSTQDTFPVDARQRKNTSGNDALSVDCDRSSCRNREKHNRKLQDKLHAEINRLQIQLASVERQRGKATSSLEEMTKRLQASSKLHASIIVKNTEIVRLEKELEKECQKNRSLLQGMEELQRKDSSSARDRNTNTKRLFKHVKLDNQELERENRNFMEEIRSLEQQCLQQESENANLKEELHQAQEIAAKLREALFKSEEVARLDISTSFIEMQKALTLVLSGEGFGKPKLSEET